MSSTNINVIYRWHKPRIVNSCFVVRGKMSAHRWKYTADSPLQPFSLLLTNNKRYLSEAAISAVRSGQQTANLVAYPCKCMFPSSMIECNSASGITARRTCSSNGFDQGGQTHQVRHHSATKNEFAFTRDYPRIDPDNPGNRKIPFSIMCLVILRYVKK